MELRVPTTTLNSSAVPGEIKYISRRKLGSTNERRFGHVYSPTRRAWHLNRCRFYCFSPRSVRSLFIMSDQKWKRFEKLIHKIHPERAPEGAKIVYDDKIMGSDSKTERQVEITIRYKLAQYEILLVIDCKDYAQPVDVIDMGAFKRLARDVRANKAVMISTNGYTPAAIEMARSAGIEPRTYLDTESTEWPSDVSIPV